MVNWSLSILRTSALLKDSIGKILMIKENERRQKLISSERGNITTDMSDKKIVRNKDIPIYPTNKMKLTNSLK